jgi:pimeloyl-ACP methyl ester carboxylesterase
VITQNIPHSAPLRARANGIEIVYEPFGDPDAPPMLLIMGLGCQMIDWHEEFCYQLAAQGYWVIRFDNRDIGLSTKFDQAGAPNIAALMEALGRGEAVQVAYLSMPWRSSPCTSWVSRWGGTSPRRWPYTALSGYPL